MLTSPYKMLRPKGSVDGLQCTMQHCCTITIPGWSHPHASLRITAGKTSGPTAPQPWLRSLPSPPHARHSCHHLLPAPSSASAHASSQAAGQAPDAPELNRPKSTHHFCDLSWDLRTDPSDQALPHQASCNPPNLNAPLQLLDSRSLGRLSLGHSPEVPNLSGCNITLQALALGRGQGQVRLLCDRHQGSSPPGQLLLPLRTLGCQLRLLGLLRRRIRCMGTCCQRNGLLRRAASAGQSVLCGRLSLLGLLQESAR